MANTSKGRFPSYGLVRGPLHSEGGVPASVANGPDVELEGGEYIIPKEAVPDYLPVLQQITQVGRDRQQMQNGNSAIDALIASASMQNGIAQPKSPVYQEGGRISNFFKKQRENFQRAAMMGENTGTRNPFLKTALEQRALQREYGLLPGQDNMALAPSLRPDVPIEEENYVPEMEEDIPIYGSKTEKAYQESLPELERLTGKYNRYLDSVRARAAGEQEGDVRRARSMYTPEEFNVEMEPNQRISPELDNEIFKMLHGMGKYENEFSPFEQLPAMPEDERGGFLDYLFGGRDNILTTRSLSEDLFGTKTGMQQGGMVQYEDGGRVSVKSKLIDAMLESNDVSKEYSRADLETLDLDTLERLQSTMLERNIGDQYGGIEDVLVSKPGSADMGEKRTYANRFDVRQGFGPDGNTSTSREQLSVGSLPVLAAFANLASRAGVSGEGALGRVLNARLPIERITEDGKTSFGLSREQGGMIEYEDGGEVHSRRMYNQGTGFNKKKSDLDGDGNISEYERKRGMAIAKSMGKMQEGGQVYADKKPISYSAKREDMLYNTGKSAEQQRDIIAQRYIYPTDDDMIFRPSAGPASGIGALKGYGLNLLLNSLTMGATGSYNALAAGLGAVREIRKMGSDKTQVKRMAKGKQPFDPVYFAKDYESGDVYSATRKGWRKLNPKTVSNIEENFPDYMKNLEAFNTGFKYRQEQGGPINNYQMGGTVNRQPMMQRPMNPAMNFSPMQQRNPRMYQDGGQVQPRKQQEMRNPNTFIGPPVNLMGPGLSDYEKAERNFEAFMDSLDRSQDINPFTGEPIDTDADIKRLKERMRQSKIPRSNQRMPMQEGGQVQLRRQAEKNLMSRQPKEKMDVIFPFSKNVPSFLYPDFIGPRTPTQNKLLERFLDDMMRNARGNKKFYIDESDKQESGMKIAREGGMVSNNNLMGSMASDQRIAALQPDIYQSKSENGVSTEQRMEVPKLAEAILPIYGLETPLSKNQGSMLRRNNVPANVLNPQVKGLINRVLVQRLSAESN